jgi:hypothetical protein
MQLSPIQLPKCDLGFIIFSQYPNCGSDGQGCFWQLQKSFILM